MKWDIFGIEILYHGTTGLVHQLLSQAKTSVWALHRLEDTQKLTESSSQNTADINRWLNNTELKLTKDVMCPWGTSSGSSSLEMVHCSLE